MEKARDESVRKAIIFMKRCAYKATAIKVELEGELNRHYSDTWTNAACSRWLKQHVSKEAKDALIYSKFYNDGSVDSEFTFTVPIDKAPLVVEYIKAFKLLAAKIGNGLEVEGAGMHIAILNSPDGNYPGGNNLDLLRATNFKKTMTHFLPALYFLGSADHRSRELRYRRPLIDLTSKYAAISGEKHVFEYRLFETCYDRPEAILDFICVIAATLKFYNIRPINFKFFNTIGEIGFKEGWGLERFFFTQKHIDALEAGVKILKPTYKTFEQLKKERNFKVDKETLSKKDKKEEAKWIFEYQLAKRESVVKQVARGSVTVQAADEYRNASKINSHKYLLLNYGTKKEYINRRLVEQGLILPGVDEYIKNKKHASEFNDVSVRVNI